MTILEKIFKKKKNQEKFLFNKYLIKNIKKSPWGMYINLGKKDSLFACIELNQLVSGNQKIKYFINSYFAINNAEANYDLFRELYSDTKKHFKEKGVSVDDFVDEKKKNKMSRFLAGTDILRMINPSIKTNEERKKILKSAYKDVEEYLSHNYNNLEEEIVNTGSFGFIPGEQSKILTPEKGLWVITEAPLCEETVLWINIHVNSDETHSEYEIKQMNCSIKELIGKKYFNETGPFKGDRPKPEFKIDVTELFERPLCEYKDTSLTEEKLRDLLCMYKQ